MAALIFRRGRLGASLFSYSALRSCLLSVSTRSCASTPDLLEEKPVLPPNHLDLMIFKADSVDELFALLNNNNKQLTVIQATNAVATLGKLALQTRGISEAVVKDKTFNDICNLINNNLPSVNHTTLVATLKNMLSLGLPPESYVVRSLETEVLWKIRKMNLRNLISLLSFHVAHQTNDLQRQVVAETLDKIQQRWFEICTPREIVTLLKHSNYFRSDFVGKLEDRAIDLLDKLSVEDLQRIFCILAEQKLRPTHLLRALAFHISKHQQKLSIKHMGNIVHAMTSLNFADASLLQRISADVLHELHTVTKPSIISSLLTAFGMLRWRHKALLEAFTDWMQRNVHHIRTQDAVSFILTLAHVDYLPKETDSLFLSITSHLTKEAIHSELIWLDVVWSLVVLEKASSDHITSILNPTFYQKILEAPGYQGLLNKRKVCLINAAAATALLNYKGSLLNEDSLDNCLSPFNERDHTHRNSVIDTLSNYVPKGKYLTCNKRVLPGIYIDAEFIVNKESKPVSLEDYKDDTDKPIDLYRMALLVLDYKSFTLHDIHLNGYASLTIRLLEKMGYTVLQIPYSEYPSQAPTVQRLKYLHQKIVEAVNMKNNSAGNIGSN